MTTRRQNKTDALLDRCLRQLKRVIDPEPPMRERQAALDAIWQDLEDEPRVTRRRERRNGD